MQPKVSIIVPVYNAGQYLEKTLNSLVGQTLQEIEIILVLDCPSDGSDKVAERFAANDSRIKLIRNERNIYVGSTRNRGIEEATAEYICFCDHDDFCDPQMYKLLYDKAKNEELDIVRSCYYRVVKGKSFANNYNSRFIPEQKDECISNILIQDRVMWNYIFKTDFLNENSLRFENRKLLGEDTLFLLSSLFKTNKIGDISDFLYYHIYYPNSTGANQNYWSVSSNIELIENLFALLTKIGKFEKYKNAFIEGLAGNLYAVGCKRALRQLPIKQIPKELKKIKQSKIVCKNINELFRSKLFFKLLKKKLAVIVFLLLVKIFI
jgi:glycosyltransferase involved in cell wall biosynthesis